MITKFHEATNDDVRELLQRLNSTRQRVRIFYGNTQTGDAWPEEHDVIGSVGNSTGPHKIPLLIHNARSIGGPALLDSCIVAIVDVRTRRWLYRHPTFNAGQWEHGAEEFTVTHNGIVHARFNTWEQAERYIKYMQGLRFSK